MLTCSHVSCINESTQALTDVSLAIQPGHVTGIVGANGSGKSTLIRCLGGAQTPSSGDITLDGKRVSPDDMCGIVGTVIQNAERQLFAKTAFEDVAYGPVNLGVSGHDLEEKVRHALAYVHLDFTRAQTTSPQAYSGGEQRRLAIAGIIAMEPRYLLFDESDVGLDPSERSSLCELIRDLAQHGVGIAVVSHDLAVIETVADDVVVMQSGRILGSGPTSEILSDHALLERAGIRAPALYSLAQMLSNAGVCDLDPSTTPEEFADQIIRAYQKVAR